MVQRVLRQSGVVLKQLAEDAAVNYGTLRQWAVGHRTPEPESVERLAVGLERRADRLRDLARELRSGDKET